MSSNKRKFNLISSPSEVVTTLKEKNEIFFSYSPGAALISENYSTGSDLQYIKDTTEYEGKVFMTSLSTQGMDISNQTHSESGPPTTLSQPIWNAADTVAPFRPKEITIPLSLTPVEKRIFGLFKRTNLKYNLKTTIRVAGGWVRDKLMGKDNDDIDIALDDLTGAQYAKMVRDMVIEEDGGERTNIDGTKNVSRVGIIKANPDQSKHLETATMFIYGQELDFVNLRSETYTDNSRIPEMTFGTALNDATRRDFTINALFYNVNTDTVEDFTEHGLHDLKDGILRTPLDPLTTFDDDPLRILRAIKFASRYAFRLEERILKAIGVDNVRLGITTKCSQERVGKELSSMLSCKRPVLAFRMLHELNLWPAVYGIYHKEFQNLVIYNERDNDGDKQRTEFQFTSMFWRNQFNLCVSFAKLLGWVWYTLSLSEASRGKNEEQQKEGTGTINSNADDNNNVVATASPQPWNFITTWSKYNGLQELNGQKIPILRCKEIYKNVNNIIAFGHGKKSNGLKEKDIQKLLFLTVLVMPFETLLYQKKKKQPKLIEYILMNSLKATTKNVQNINILLRCSLRFQTEAQKLFSNSMKDAAESITRADIAFIVNDAKSLWPFAIDIAMIRDLIHINGWSMLYGNDENNFFNRARATGIDANKSMLNEVKGNNVANNKTKFVETTLFNQFIKKYQLLYDYIENKKIDCIWLDKPIMDGKVLMKELDLKPGPGISIMVNKMKRWQFNNPKGTVEACKEFLLHEKK